MKSILTDTFIITHYDMFNRRVKYYQRSSISIPAYQYYYYFYDGQQCIEDVWYSLINGGVSRVDGLRVFGIGIDELLYQRIWLGDEYKETYCHSDALGSIYGLTDDAANIVEYYEYDIYGAPSIYDIPDGQLRHSSAYANRYLFTGREYHTATQLYYYRARYYSPVLGRFLSRDPIGRPSTDYKYARSSPSVYNDNTGLQEKPPGFKRGKGAVRTEQDFWWESVWAVIPRFWFSIGKRKYLFDVYSNEALNEAALQNANEHESVVASADASGKQWALALLLYFDKDERNDFIKKLYELADKGTPWEELSLDARWARKLMKRMSKYLERTQGNGVPVFSAKESDFPGDRFRMPKAKVYKCIRENEGCKLCDDRNLWTVAATGFGEGGKTFYRAAGVTNKDEAGIIGEVNFRCGFLVFDLLHNDKIVDRFTVYLRNE